MTSPTREGTWTIVQVLNSFRADGWWTTERCCRAVLSYSHSDSPPGASLGLEHALDWTARFTSPRCKAPCEVVLGGVRTPVPHPARCRICGMRQGIGRLTSAGRHSVGIGEDDLDRRPSAAAPSRWHAHRGGLRCTLGRPCTGRFAVMAHETTHSHSQGKTGADPRRGTPDSLPGPNSGENHRPGPGGNAARLHRRAGGGRGPYVCRRLDRADRTRRLGRTNGRPGNGRHAPHRRGRVAVAAWRGLSSGLAGAALQAVPMSPG